MSNKNEFIEWRSKEIAKILLRKSGIPLNIDAFPTPIFDFFVTKQDNPKIRFAVEIKPTRFFEKTISSHIKQLITYRNFGMINLPALILKVDDLKETAEIDFLVIPSKTGKLLIRKNYSFKKLTQKSFITFLDKITNWWVINEKG